MKGLVLYASKYGATAQYAGWISGHLHMPSFSLANVAEAELKACDYIIIGSAVYIGKLLARNWIRQHAQLLQHKQLFLFVVSAGLTSDEEQQEEVIGNNIPASLRERFTIYFFPGRLRVKQLSWIDRFLLKMGARVEKDPFKKRQMLTDMDAVQEENISSLLADITKMLEGNKTALPGLEQFNKQQV